MMIINMKIEGDSYNLSQKNNKMRIPNQIVPLNINKSSSCFVDLFLETKDVFYRYFTKHIFSIHL